MEEITVRPRRRKSGGGGVGAAAAAASAAGGVRRRAKGGNEVGAVPPPRSARGREGRIKGNGMMRWHLWTSPHPGCLFVDGRQFI